MSALPRTQALAARIGLPVAASLLAVASIEVGMRIWRAATGPAMQDGRPGLSARERWAFRHALVGRRPLTGGTFNVYYFGGSTMASRHLIGLIGKMAGDEIAGRPIRAFRVAEDAQDLHYNALRLHAILDEPERFRPDLFVIYAGHNEYLRFHDAGEGVRWSRRYPALLDSVAERSYAVRALLDRARSYRVEIDDRKLFDAPLFPAAGYAAVTEAYRQTLERIADRSRERGVPVIVSTVAGNLRGLGAEPLDRLRRHAAPARRRAPPRRGA
jgi:hypothetical protein